MDTKTVKLKKPITREGEEPITEVSLREPTGKELKLLDKTKGAVAGSINMACRLCEQGLSPEEFDVMPASDVLAVLDLLGEWMDPDGHASAR